MRVLAIGFLVIASPALASDWVDAGGSSDGTKLYIDIESIQRGQIEGQAWVKFDYSKVKSVRHRSSKELWKFKCYQKTSFTAHWIDYSANGNVIKSGSPFEADYKYEPVAPDTLGETIMGLVCTTPAPAFDPSKPYKTEGPK